MVTLGATRLLGAREIAERLRAKGCEERMVRGSRQWVGVRQRGATDDDDREQMTMPGSTLEQQIPKSPCRQNSHSGPLGNKCSQVLPAPSEQDPEREAIQAEGGAL